MHRFTPSALLSSALLVLAATTPAKAADGIFSEVRLGVLWHDPHFIDGKENGADLNAELRFVSPVPDTCCGALPRWAQWLIHPRPHVGGSVNTNGYTDFVYFGVTWSPLLFTDVISSGDGIALNLTFGPSFNDGKRSTPFLRERDRKALGQSFLFHSAGEVEYDFNANYNLSLLVEHYSNAGLAKQNAGISNVGLRVGYKF